MLKRLLPILLLTLLLPACNGSGAKCAERVWTGEFGLCLQKGWEQVPDEVLRERGIPEETIAAFQPTQKREGQRDTIVISRERLPAELSFKKYADANIESIEGMPEYVSLERRDTEIDGEETSLHIFTARPIPNLPTRRFYQLSITKETRGYTITGTLPLTVEQDVEDTMISIILSATLQNTP